MTLGRRLARIATDATVRWPRAWPLFRPAMRKQFDAIAPTWDAMRGPESFAPFEAALAAIHGPVGTALDIGTGTGEGALALARRFPEADVVGVDVAEAMLELARRKAPHLRFVRADASRLPFEDASFDLVAHANMIPFFDEVARVARPGAWALFAFSLGPATPIWVPPARLRNELGRRGFAQFEEFPAGSGVAFLARRQ